MAVRLLALAALLAAVGLLSGCAARTSPDVAEATGGDLTVYSSLPLQGPQAQASEQLVGGEKLAVGRVRHIRLRDGKPLSSDGPYAEAKDVVGGYFVIEAKDDAEADSIARDCPHLWNATNWVELRPIDLMTAAEQLAKAKAAV